MAVLGLGASYNNGTRDMTNAFLNNGVACVGWMAADYPALHKFFKHIKMGDIIYIKAKTPQVGLIIKGIGVVVDDTIFTNRRLGQACIKVKWKWRGNERLGRIADKYNVRNNTMYEEYNPEIITRVIELLLSDS